MVLLKKTDWILFLSTILISCIGILMIYSTSIEASGVDYSFVTRQILYLLFGITLFFIVSRADFRFLANYSFLLYALVIILLLVTYFVGFTSKGATRWIDLKIVTLQASEIAKPILILTLANFFTKYPPSHLKNVVFSLFLVGAPSLLIFFQPDLGNTLVLVILWVILIFAAGIRFSQIVFFALTSAIIAPVIWSFLREYQKQRLISFLNPESDPLGSGYNLVQAIIAVGSGGIFGRGFGRGTQSQLNFLPEQKTDFIFATTAEELGFLGVCLVFLGLALIVYRTMVILSRSSDKLASLICLGVAGMIVTHVLINVGMNLGLFPVTGITLPLVSFGGSSLISTMIALGIVNAVSIHTSKFSSIRTS